METHPKKLAIFKIASNSV